MSKRLKTGDKIKLTIAQHGRNCLVEVNGEILPGVQAFRVDADVHGQTRLFLDMIWPWPPQRPIQREEWEGYFISDEDMEAIQDLIAFRQWQKGNVAQDDESISNGES